MDKMRTQVIDMQRKIKDLMDEPSASAARKLTAEVQALEDDLQVKKNAKTIEDRVERIIQLIRGDAKNARIMNYEHLDMLEKWFEGVRNQLRKM